MMRKIRGAGGAGAAALVALLVASCGDGRDGGEGGTGAASRDTAATDTRQVVLFLGTSLTAGLGVAPEDAFPALIQGRIDAAGLPARVVSAGVNGETSAGGLRRLDWWLRQRVDVLVLELGANDGLRGQDIDAMRDNLQTIINRTRDVYPDVAIVIAGMEAPPSLGGRYTGQFRTVFRELAEQNGVALIPFLLDGVAAEPGLNQADGIHPNEDGHAVIARNVWAVLEPVLRRVGVAAPDAGQ